MGCFLTTSPDIPAGFFSSFRFSTLPPISKKQKVVEVFDAGEGALRFTFHTPFTAAGKVHGSTAEQCKKLTELEVGGKGGRTAPGALGKLKVLFTLFFRHINFVGLVVSSGTGIISASFSFLEAAA